MALGNVECTKLNLSTNCHNVHVLMFIETLHLLVRVQVGASVRCISWLDSSCVLVGCLDGKIHQWRIGQQVNVSCCCYCCCCFSHDGCVCVSVTS